MLNFFAKYTLDALMTNPVCVTFVSNVFISDTAYAKNCNDDSWYDFNDSSVSAADANAAVVS